MDNITHTLTALAVARAGVNKWSRGATASLVLACNAPDLDVVTSLNGVVAYLTHHRGFTHGLVGGALLAIAVAAGVHAFLPGSRFRALLAASFLGTVLHVFMDLWTSYGTRALLPLDGTWYAWDIVFIVDPWILGALALAILAAAAGPRWRRLAPQVALALIAAYVGARVILHDRAVAAARVALPQSSDLRLVVLPTPINPLRWRVVADTGKDFRTGRLDLASGAIALVLAPKAPETPEVAVARSHSDVAAAFLAFSTFPQLETHASAEGTEVVWRDLRFTDRRREGFIARIVVGADGSIKDQSFRF